jgi:hypothetical protein
VIHHISNLIPKNINRALKEYINIVVIKPIISMFNVHNNQDNSLIMSSTEFYTPGNLFYSTLRKYIASPDNGQKILKYNKNDQQIIEQKEV